MIMCVSVFVSKYMYNIEADINILVIKIIPSSVMFDYGFESEVYSLL